MKNSEKCNLKIKKTLSKKHRVLFFLLGKKAEKDLDFALKHVKLSEKSLKVLWIVGEENLKSREKFTQLIKTNDESSIKLHLCSYNNSISLLGSSYHACIFNSFDFITPNLMARCIETVLGGGVIIFLLNTVHHLHEIETIKMKQHEKYATSWFPMVYTRFNSRFFCSLSHCKSAFIIQNKSLAALCNEDEEDEDAYSCSSTDEGESDGETTKGTKIGQIVQHLSNHKELHSITKLIKCCATLHQVKVLVKFHQIIQSSFPCILSLTSDRGRGKSSSLGLLLALAVNKGLSNIMVTAPSLSNAQTLFQFLIIGLDALGLKRDEDYKVEKDEEEMLSKVTVFNRHEQIVQFEEASRHDLLTKGSLLCIDESASIPLNWVKKLTNAKLCIMASTIKGYEGTGRSLSLKLMKDLREKYSTTNSNKNAGISNTLGCEDALKGSKNRHKVSKVKTSNHIVFDENCETDVGSFDVEDDKALENTKKLTKFLLSSCKNKVSKQENQLVELQLKEAIRYNDNDPVEIWMDTLFFLTPSNFYSFSTLPQTKACQLFYVNLNALFDSSPTSEKLLHSIVSILVESHYKNSPDDLQMLADAPAHGIFCLLPPNTNQLKRKHEDSGHRYNNDKSYPLDPCNLPEILCVIQVAYEGNMQKDYYKQNHNSREKASGDLIPWLLDHQFPGSKMAFKKVMRIVRIATNSRYTRMGFGKRSLTLLEEFFSMKKVIDKDLEKEVSHQKNNISNNAKRNAIDKEVFIAMPYCGVDYDIEYMGASFGCSPLLVRFWQSVGMCPVYLSQAVNSSTGEQSCVFIKTLKNEKNMKKIRKMHQDFIRRFCHLLPYDFDTMDSRCCVHMIKGTRVDPSTLNAELFNLSHNDVKRLQLYINDVIEWKVVKDLMHRIIMAYAVHGGVIADDVDKMAILVGVGLQGKSFDILTRELNEKKEDYKKFSKVDRKNNSKKHLTYYQHYDVNTVVGLMNKAFKEILTVVVGT